LKTEFDLWNSVEDWIWSLKFCWRLNLVSEIQLKTEIQLLKTEFGHQHIKFIRIFYIFKENQLPILWEMWLRIFFTLIPSSHSHHFDRRRNSVTDISSSLEYFIFSKKIKCEFYEKCDLEYFLVSFFHLIRIILFVDGIWSPTSSSLECFIFSKKINHRFYVKCDLEYFSLSFFHLFHIILFADGIWLPAYQVHQNILYF
jgi:hypothetical protein